MKKIFSLLAAVLFAGAMMADSYTITFKEGTGTSSDGSTKVTTIADIISDGASYVSEVATATNVYNARVGRGIKLGTSSKAGELTLTLAAPVQATSIVVTARKYNDSEKTFTIQGQEFTAGDGDDFAEYTYTYATATEISSIALASPKRIYFTSVTVNYGGEVVPPTPTMNYYVTGSMTNWGPNANYMLTPDNGGLYKGEFTFAANDEFKVTYSDGTTIDNANWFPTGMDNNYKITEDGDYAITFNPAGNVQDWYYGYFTVAKKEVPVVTPITCAAVYALEKNAEVTLNDVTVTYVSGKNVWVKDATGAMLLYLSADATWKAGDVLAGVAGVVDIYNGLYEVKPSADQAAAVVATAGEAPAPEELAVVADADVNKYIVLKGVTAEGAFAEGKASNLNITLGENTYVLRNFMKNAYTFEAGKSYNVTAVVSYYNALQLYFIDAEEVAGPVVFDHKLYGSATLPVVDKTYFATTSGWALDNDSHAEIVNDYDIHIALVNSKEEEWQSQVFVNPGFTWEVGAYYKMELDLTTNNQLGGVHFKVDDNGAGFFDSYPNDNLFLAGQTTHFVADSIYVSQEPTNGGQLIFSIGWCDANTDIVISNIVITKYEAPVVPGTIALDFTEGGGWVDNSYFEEYGSTDLVLYNIPVVGQELAGDGEYLNLDFYPEDANDISGTYTIADETLDDYYTYLMVVNGTDTAEVMFTAGTVTFNVLAKSEEQSAAQIAIAAELTGDDGNVYTINGTFVLYYDFIEVEEGVENVATDPKVAIKRIEKGELIIEKNGVRYNANGQVVR